MLIHTFKYLNFYNIIDHIIRIKKSIFKKVVELLVKLKILIPYLAALGGFPILSLYSYAFGVISSDFTSLVWLIILFEIMIGTLFLMHIIYNSQERSVILIANPEKSIKIEEKHLTQNVC